MTYTLAIGGDRVELLRGMATVVKSATADGTVPRAPDEVLIDLGGRKVRVAVRGGTPVADGDDVAVWARRRGELYQALAFRNATRDVLAYPLGVGARSVIGLLATLGGGYLMEGLYLERWGAQMSAAPFGLCLAGAGLTLVTGLLLLFSGARWSARLRAL
jgi:hypothetical protein